MTPFSQEVGASSPLCLLPSSRYCGWGKGASGPGLALSYLFLSAPEVATACNSESSQAACAFDCSSAGESIDVLEMDVMLLQHLGFSGVTLSQTDAAPQQVTEAGGVWKVGLGGQEGPPALCCCWSTCSSNESLYLGHHHCHPFSCRDVA